MEEMRKYGEQLCKSHRFWELVKVTEYSVTVVNHQDNKDVVETYMLSYFWKR